MIRIDEIWLTTEPLDMRAGTWHGDQVELSPKQLTALVQGRPWQRIGSAGAISVL